MLVRIRRFLRQREAWLLPLARGLINATAVTFVLRQAAHPLPAALAEGLAAGAQSALLQAQPIAAGYARWLAEAPGELHRFARWSAVSTIYVTGIQLAGALATQTGLAPMTVLAAAFSSSVLGAGQYPWVAALAVRRQRGERRRCPQRRADLRFAADLETMVVSAGFVSLTALQALGLPAVRFVLVGVGLFGLGRYLAIKHRRAGWAFAPRVGESSSLTMPAVRI